MFIQVEIKDKYRQINQFYYLAIRLSVILDYTRTKLSLSNLYFFKSCLTIKEKIKDNSNKQEYTMRTTLELSMVLSI